MRRLLAAPLFVLSFLFAFAFSWAADVDATGVSCTWSKSGNTYTGACRKTDQNMNFQHRMMVVCTDGVNGQFTNYGPWRLTLQYSWNWSSAYGCPPGTIFQYAGVAWRVV